jgi:hypothetical protein
VISSTKHTQLRGIGVGPEVGFSVGQRDGSGVGRGVGGAVNLGVGMAVVGCIRYGMDGSNTKPRGEQEKGKPGAGLFLSGSSFSNANHVFVLLSIKSNLCVSSFGKICRDIKFMRNKISVCFGCMDNGTHPAAKNGK